MSVISSNIVISQTPPRQNIVQRVVAVRNVTFQIVWRRTNRVRT